MTTRGGHPPVLTSAVEGVAVCSWTTSRFDADHMVRRGVRRQSQQLSCRADRRDCALSPRLKLITQRERTRYGCARRAPTSGVRRPGWCDTSRCCSTAEGLAEPPTFCFSGASERYRDVAGRGLIWRLAGITVCRDRLTSLDGCQCWLPFWLPAPTTQLRRVTKL
jgi:hypothetical protein